jgi:hypothetical protein
MPDTLCGFNDMPGGASGAEQLTAWGPTLLVDIGFDPNFKMQLPVVVPVAGITGIHALVDTGAGESCIDSLLAGQLNLPIVDRRAGIWRAWLSNRQRVSGSNPCSDAQIHHIWCIRRGRTCGPGGKPTRL